MSEKPELIIEVINGVAGWALSVNDCRVAGPKPWGGGTVLKSWNVDIAELEAIIAKAKSTPEQPDSERKD